MRVTITAINAFPLVIAGVEVRDDDRIVVDDKDLWIHGEILDRPARCPPDCFLTNAYLNSQRLCRFRRQSRHQRLTACFTATYLAMRA